MVKWLIYKSKDGYAGTIQNMTILNDRFREFTRFISFSLLFLVGITLQSYDIS